MDCASCGEANRSAARFCSSCGTPLTTRCPACGTEHDPAARFCDSCGTVLIAGDAPLAATETETRRVVTLVFADLIGSTTLHERIDAESARRVMAGYYAALSTVVEGHDGTVIKLLGDGVLAGFGVQRAQEDDAVRAVRAAVAMHAAMTELATEFGELAGELGLRVGVNTGEVVVSDEDDDVVGDPVNVAARLQHEANDGDVLIGDSTRRLVVDVVTLEAAGEFALKGRTGAVAAHKVVSLEPPATAPTTSFVGRDDELRRILETQSRSVLRREAKLAVIVGSPGLGKSRLMDEVARRLAGEATILTARCEAGGGPTFTPVADALRGLVSTDLDEMVAEDEPERERIIDGAVGLCAGEPGPPEETFWVVRRVLGALGRRGPVVLALDDLHWAEPLLLDLIEHLVEWTTDVPLLVLGAARPELRDTRSSLTTAGETADEVVALDGLDAGAATRLAADAIGAAELPAAVAGRVLAASEGNPLFLGALVRMLVDDGALQWDGDRWAATVDLDDIEMPPTIHALLAARIDRLDPSVRLVLERASVIGRQFSRDAVMHLLPQELHADLDATLEALRRSELVEPDATWFLGEPSIRFHHALIRDAAYRRLLKDARADLHATFAEWLEMRLGDATEQDEAIGWHLEQAYQHRQELGPLDDRSRSLGTRAAERLGAEGRRALARDDLTVAAGLLGRAVALLDAADPQRPDLLLDWCEALLAGGDVSAAPAAIDDLGRSADDERLRAWHTSFVGHLVVLTDPGRLRETAVGVTSAADTLAALGDAAGEAKAHSVRALALARLGEVGACETALDKALVAARRADDRRRSNAVLAGAPVAALWGPSPVTRASGRCLDVVRVLRITAAAPAVEAVAMRCQAVLEALRGRGDAARRMITASRRTVEDLGLTTRILEADMAAGLIELVNDDAGAAEQLLRPTYEGFRDRGLGVDAAQAGALLGRALLALNRVSEAEAISHECEVMAGDDLKAAIAWRGVRAEALARRGEYGRAIEFAREAVALASNTDALLDHADARVALAVALRVAGQHTEADAEMAAAFELWSAKGATALLGDGEAPGAESSPPTKVFDGGDDLERATARLHERHADTAGDANLAFAALLTSERRWRDGDWDGVLAVYDRNAYVLDDQRSMMHVRSSGDEFVENLRFLFDDGAFTSTFEAGRGDRLTLVRAEYTSNRAGAFSSEHYTVAEADAEGRLVAMVVFDLNDRDAAYAELEARHRREVSRSDVETNAATRMLDHFAAAMAARDLDAAAALVAPEFRSISRRRLLQSESNRDEYLEFMRMVAVMESAETTGGLLATRGDRLAITRLSFRGQDRSVGASEVDYIDVVEVDAQGRRRYEVIFDVEDLHAAYEELDRLYAEGGGSAGAGEASGGPARMPSNAASRASDGTFAYFDAHDWSALEASVHADFTYRDHRNGMHTEFDTDQWIESMRLMVASSAQHDRQQLSVLGDRLALEWVRWTGTSTDPDAEGAEFEVEVLRVVEVDDEGLLTAVASYDVSDRRTANDDLWKRYEQSDEGQQIPDVLYRNRTAFNRQDIDAVRATLRHDSVFDDHRRTGVGALGVEPYLESAAALFDETDELVSEMVYRIAASQRGSLSVGRTVGTASRGGAFENLFLRLFVTDGDLITHVEIFELDDLDAARARFEEFCPRDAAVPLNAVNRVLQRVDASYAARDWEAFAALTHEEFVFEERRHLSHFVSGRPTFIEGAQLMAEAGAILQRSVLSTLGDRFSLDRLRWTASADNGGTGAFEVELLGVQQLDASGLIIAIVCFDPDDRVAANDEMWQRFRKSEEGRVLPSVVFDAIEAVNRGDVEALRAAMADDFIVVDHRPLGYEPLGADEYAQFFEALIAETSDFAYESVHTLRITAGGAAEVARLRGHTSEGAAFEFEFLRVTTAKHGRLAVMEVFAQDDVDAAIARFEELQREPLDVLSNAATRALDRAQTLFEAQDWDALEAIASPGLVFGDRRSQVLVNADRDGWLQSSKLMAAAGAKERRTVLSVLGDGLALYSSIWSAEVDGALIEVETLGTVEVDASGRFVALGHYDFDDHRCANADLWSRFCASQPENRALAVAGDVVAALNGQDLDAVRGLLAEDCMVFDHRSPAYEPMDRDQYLVYLAALTNETSDFIYGTTALLRIAPEGLVELSRLVGHSLDGGAFEKTGLRVTVVRDGRVTAMETFPLDAEDAALARFEELRRLDASRVPPTTATRAMDRWEAALVAGDRRAIEDLCAESLVFDDRRALNRTTGDLAAWKRTTEATLASKVRLERTVLSTLGDRLELERQHWAGEVDGAVIDGESLTIREVDASGHFTAVVIFDADDRVAANDELRKRFQAAEEGAVLPSVIFEAVRAVNHRDLAALRATMADDFELVDHRPLGVERMDADAYLEFFGSLVSETADSVYETMYAPRISPAGAVDMARIQGHTVDGAVYEIVWTQVTVVRCGRLAVMEMFASEDVDAAVARFEELTGDGV